MRMRGSVFSPKAIIMLAAAGNQTHAHVAAEEATATAFLIVSTLKHGSERGYAIPAFVLLVAQKKVKEFLVDVHRLLQIRLKEAKARAAHLYVEWVERVRLARRPTIFCGLQMHLWVESQLLAVCQLVTVQYIWFVLLSRYCTIDAVLIRFSVNSLHPLCPPHVVVVKFITVLV